MDGEYADHLGHVHGAAAAQADDTGAFFPGVLAVAGADDARAGIALHTGEDGVRDVRGGQHRGDPVDDAGADESLVGDDQDLLAGREEIGEKGDGTRAVDDLRGAAEVEDRLEWHGGSSRVGVDENEKKKEKSASSVKMGKAGFPERDVNELAVDLLSFASSFGKWYDRLVYSEECHSIRYAGIMETIELQIDEKIAARARQLAEQRHCSLEDLVREIIEQLASFGGTADTLLGMFADEADLVDRVVDSALKAREEHPLRQPCG